MQLVRWARRLAVVGMLGSSCLIAAAEEPDGQPDVQSLLRRLEAAERRIAELQEQQQRQPPSAFLYSSENTEHVTPAAMPSQQRELAERVNELETRWKKQEDEAAKKAAAGPSYPTYKVIGRVHADSVWMNQDDRNQAAFGDIDDGTNFRRARIGVEGLLFDNSDYRLEVDFAGSGRPSFNDVYTTIKELPVLGNIRIGHFKEPFSLEQLTSANYMMFMERSPGDSAFVPARNLGVMTFNKLESETMTWAAGWFRTGSDEFGDDITVDTPPVNGLDGSGEQSVTARVTWNPYYDEGSGGRYVLHLGADYSFRDADEGQVSFGSTPEVRLRTSSTGIGGSGEGSIPSFVSTGVIPADHHQVFGAEAALVWGSFSVQSEYMAAVVDRTAAGDAFFDGMYVQASYFLTGEHRVYNRATGTFDRVRPLENFFRVSTEDSGICTGWGAWELKARWSTIDLNDAGIEGGRLADLTFGVNWYLNPNFRIMLDYIHADLDKPTAPGAGHSDSNVLAMRAMFFW